VVQRDFLKLGTFLGKQPKKEFLLPREITLSFHLDKPATGSRQYLDNLLKGQRTSRISKRISITILIL
jgi:hypothetical protein